MEFKDIELYYKNCYRFSQMTGLSASCYKRFTRGIPIAYQHLIEAQTSGELKADFSTSVEYKKFKESGKI